MIEANDLVIGHLYEDDKGVQLIFCGFGYYKRFVPGNRLYDWQCPNESFLYAKKADVDKKISDGRLSPSWDKYDGKRRKGCQTDFGSTILFSKKPRKVVKDLGILYPESMFQNLTIEDETITTTVFWSIINK